MNKYHELMVEKGFHGDDKFGADGTPDARTRIVFAGLILTEWREQKIDSYDPQKSKWYFEKDGKPCGELSEWCDLWLRCADTLGACKAQISGPIAIVDHRPSLDTTCCAVSQAIECARRGKFNEYDGLIRAIMSCASEKGDSLRRFGELPDFKSAVEIKHAYNATRPRKHGKLA